jgi:hypothetical protein
MSCLGSAGDVVGGFCVNAGADDQHHEHPPPCLPDSSTNATTGGVVVVLPESAPSPLVEEDAGGLDDSDNLQGSEAADDRTKETYWDYAASRQDEETGTLELSGKGPDDGAKKDALHNASQIPTESDATKDASAETPKKGASRKQKKTQKDDTSQSQKDDDQPQRAETEVEQEDVEDIGGHGGDDGDGGAKVTLPNLQEAVKTQVLFLSQIGVMVTHVKWCVPGFDEHVAAFQCLINVHRM